MSGEHECVFPEEQEPSGRLILAPCLTCGMSALDALDQLRRQLEDVRADFAEAVQREVLLGTGDNGRIHSGLVLTEWLLIASTAGWTADGDPVSQVVIVPSDDPPHRHQGLIRNADIRFEADTVEDLRRSMGGD